MPKPDFNLLVALDALLTGGSVARDDRRSAAGQDRTQPGSYGDCRETLALAVLL
jgi:hypothetical protein